MTGARMAEKGRAAPPLLGDSDALKHDYHTGDLQLHDSQRGHVTLRHAVYAQDRNEIVITGELPVINAGGLEAVAPRATKTRAASFLS